MFRLFVRSGKLPLMMNEKDEIGRNDLFPNGGRHVVKVSFLYCLKHNIEVYNVHCWFGFRKSYYHQLVWFRALARRRKISRQGKQTSPSLSSRFRSATYGHLPGVLMVGTGICECKGISLVLLNLFG